MAKKLEAVAATLILVQRVLERLTHDIQERAPRVAVEYTMTEDEFDALEQIEGDLYLLLYDESEDTDPEDYTIPLATLLGWDDPPA